MKGIAVEPIQRDMDTLKKQIVELAKNNVPREKIRKQLKCSYDLVKNVLDEENIKYNKPNRIDSLREKIIELAKQNPSKAFIRRQLHCGNELIELVLDEAQIQLISKKDRLRPQIIELSKNMSKLDIADQLGTTYHLVSEVFEEEGIQPYRKLHPRPRKTKKDELRPQILELAKKGISKEDIATQLGCSKGMVYKVFREEGIKGSTKKDRLRPQIIELAKAGLSKQKIANQLVCSYSLVSQVFKEEGIS